MQIIGQWWEDPKLRKALSLALRRAALAGGYTALSILLVELSKEPTLIALAPLLLAINRFIQALRSYPED